MSGSPHGVFGVLGVCANDGRAIAAAKAKACAGRMNQAMEVLLIKGGFFHGPRTASINGQSGLQGVNTAVAMWLTSWLVTANPPVGCDIGTTVDPIVVPPDGSLCDTRAV